MRTADQLRNRPLVDKARGRRIGYTVEHSQSGRVALHEHLLPYRLRLRQSLYADVIGPLGGARDIADAILAGRDRSCRSRLGRKIASRLCVGHACRGTATTTEHAAACGLRRPSARTYQALRRRAQAARADPDAW